MALAAIVSVAAVAMAAIAAVVWFARDAMASRTEVGRAAVERAVAAGRAENAEAALETSERLRKAERARSAALEKELHDAEVHVADPAPPARGARNRVLAGWRESLDAAAGADDPPEGVRCGTLVVPPLRARGGGPEGAGDPGGDPGVPG